MLTKKILATCFLSFMFYQSCVQAQVYPLPSSNQSLIGTVKFHKLASSDTISALTEQYDIGFNAIKKANPHLQFDRRLFTGSLVQLPTQHLLPNLPRTGIVINLPEMRLYFFAEQSNTVYSFPIGIGKIGKTIPIKRAFVTRKAKDPSWTPPEDIRQFNLDQGIVLPHIMPPGPNNPLGPYAIYMSIPTYLIHSTIFPESIGRRASFGCIRMFKPDIEILFPIVEKKIPIIIVNTPIKFGFENNRLYMEVHEPLEEHQNDPSQSLPSVVHELIKKIPEKTLVDWQKVSFLMDEQDGSPHEIGVK